MSRKRNANRGGPVIVLLIFIFIFIFSPFQLISEAEREYKIKAGFIYRFLFFTSWPPQPNIEADQTIIIGILGDVPFDDIFNIIDGENVTGKRLSVRQFSLRTAPDTLRRCRLIYISPKLKTSLNNILELLKGFPVLTISEMEGFSEKGGMINFIKEHNRVAFEINTNAAEAVGITFSSKLLRVATRVIGENGKKTEIKE